MKPHSTIATIITCHNRKQKTLASLAALFNQVLPADVLLVVYLVDAASTDGTPEAVQETYPLVKLLGGDGNLFWNGGMRQGLAEAMKHGYDYYLWLNDDTVLEPSAVNTMLATSRSLAEQGHRRPIAVGSTHDATTGALTYGGWLRTSWWHPLHFRLLEPIAEAQQCSTMNGNCVLIPREVVEVVGNLDPAFIHSMGDIDYGLRSVQQNCTVWVVPGYVGTCSTNPSEGNCWEDPNMSLLDRWKKVMQPKGFSPKESKVLVQRHTNILWPIYWLLPYLRLILTSLRRGPVGYRG
ncbi:MAG: glycosyltransferase family 2 protein [Oscillatoriales cyanobacterium]|uniref:Glycosyltransferase family 2 protein n=1 Tax=Microcoleus anatoxicus PTRS2 TaxID=2705321 RepID=A0ABU8YMA2_9CYAN|nr:MAG: glycosyltransferase family 2 protein [Oscillatoriales cyanobacterium]TAD94572.1 MAG: glycosyltransferase family 2 protein [Oscillatoriales cyanobacterium]TAE02158.1 MAG: glycosyltransferase family 2 protein [Oscillatoriales cyanobacterium]TAF05921.1 MAG: glycosyltransferase family 2 protein [Oscillatoriales cyanobacterium]TAF44021.1 MAG: glycosyltransferase family 2 protein [Oscillatoriales cyanobacterium]